MTQEGWSEIDRQAEREAVAMQRRGAARKQWGAIASQVESRSGGCFRTTRGVGIGAAAPPGKVLVVDQKGGE